MKKYFQKKNIIIGKIDQEHPHSLEISKEIDKTLSSVTNMVNDLASFSDSKHK
ncbi:hypothetical protein [Bacillus mesophilum]|uniref:hypothetical protein n=1 Tax=Bacillus mesophilum TaxID=1071718 RepID=UPI0013758DAA|nr:hypothetical protein [Bacillus mesophilum]